MDSELGHRLRSWLVHKLLSVGDVQSLEVQQL
jgi:hypothetical protein